MQRVSVATGALLGGLTSLPLIALSYLGEQFAGLPFIPFDFFDWLARVLPGNVIVVGTETIVNVVTTFNLGPTSTVAKRIEQLTGIVLVIVAGAVIGAIIAWASRATRWSGQTTGFSTGIVAFLTFAAIEIDLGLSGRVGLDLLWLAILIAGWGAVLGSLLEHPAAAPAPPAGAQPERRAALLKIAGGSLGLALGGWGLGRLLAAQETSTGAGQPLANLQTTTVEPSSTPAPAATSTPAGTATAGPSATPPPTASPTAELTATATMRERVEAAPGTRPEITPNDDFYRIDINTRPVTIEGQSWVLEVEGLFDNPRPLTLEDMMAYPSVTQPVTMACISNRIGGDLIGTSNWTGVRLRDVLDDLGLKPEAQELYIEGADGFFESVIMEDMMDPRTLLVYGMNGETLPVEHGFPLRIYIPNRYGMKQPKWIKRIEAIDHEGPGYWVERGWSEEARPRIVSIIDTVATDQVVDGKVPVGGIAWAGDRGIQKVEVQVDNGEWRAAALRTPPLSGLTWIQWRYDWPADPGQHTLRVRATDGTGALQIEKESPPAPAGATGYHAYPVRI